MWPNQYHLHIWLDSLVEESISGLKVKCDQIRDVYFMFGVKHSGSRSSSFICISHCTFSLHMPTGNRRSSMIAVQKWSQLPRDSNITAPLTQNACRPPPFHTFPCGATVRILLNHIFTLEFVKLCFRNTPLYFFSFETKIKLKVKLKVKLNLEV